MVCESKRPTHAHACGAWEHAPYASWSRAADGDDCACRSARRCSAVASLQILKGFTVIGAAAATPLLPASPASAGGGWRLALRGCWAGGCVPLDDIARVNPCSPGAGAVRNTLRGAGNDAATGRARYTRRTARAIMPRRSIDIGETRLAESRIPMTIQLPPPRPRPSQRSRNLSPSRAFRALRETAEDPV